MKGAKRTRGDDDHDAEDSDSSLKKSRSRSLEDKPTVKPLAMQESVSPTERPVNSPSGRLFLPPVYGDNHASSQSTRSTDWSNQPANTVPPGLQRSVLDPYRQFSGHSSNSSSTPHPISAQGQGYMSRSGDGSMAPPDRSEDSPQQMPSSYDYPYSYRPSTAQQAATVRVSNRLPPLLSQNSAGVYNSREPLSHYNEGNSDHYQARDTSLRRSHPQSEIQHSFYSQQPSTSSSKSDTRDNMHAIDPGSPHTGRAVDGNLTPPPRPAQAAENPNQQFPLEQAATLKPKAWGGRHDVDALLDPEGMNSYPQPNVSEMRSKRNLRDSTKSGMDK